MAVRWCADDRGEGCPHSFPSVDRCYRPEREGMLPDDDPLEVIRVEDEEVREFGVSWVDRDCAVCFVKVCFEEFDCVSHLAELSYEVSEVIDVLVV